MSVFYNIWAKQGYRIIDAKQAKMPNWSEKKV